MQFTIVKGYYWSKELFIEHFSQAVYPGNFPENFSKKFPKIFQNRRSDWIDLGKNKGEYEI
jgi:hypothetical protein